jgi:hypothetical protein
VEETIAWAIAALCSNSDSTDDEIVDLLVGHGVPPGLAARAILMLPLAFGRKLLRGMIVAPDEIHEGERVRALSSDPVFAAAAARAEDATRDQMQAIALRSSEVHAVNSALQAGAKPEGLVVSAPRTGERPDAEPDPAWARTALAALVAAHDSKLAWRARVFPRELVTGKAQLQLDVVVPTTGERLVVESFAGLGTTIREATADAINKFARASLHVLLAALEGRADDQVTWETWGTFRACLGPLLRQWSQTLPVDYAPFLDAVKARLVAAPLSRELHWHRTFVAVGETQLYGFDSLVDNETWPAGAELVESWAWPRGPEAYALRHFIVLVPT